MKKIIVILICFSILGCAAKTKRVASHSTKGNDYFAYIDAELSSLSGLYKDSLRAFEGLVSKNPHSAFLLYRLASSQMQAKEYDSAIETAKKSIEIKPDFSRALTLLGQLYFLKGDFVKASSALENALKHDQNEEIYLLLSRQYSERKDYRNAVAVLERLLKVEPDSVSALITIAAIYSEKLKDDKKAKQYYERALELIPDELNILNALAQLYLNMNNKAEAMKYFRKMEEIAPDDVVVKLKISLLYYEMGLKQKALDSFKEVLENNPNADKIRYFLGVLYEGMGKIDEAVIEYKKVPPNSIFYQDSRLRIATLFKMKGDTNGAIESLKAAWKAKKGVLVFYEYAAAIAEDEKDYKTGIEILNESLKEFDKNDNVLMWLGMLYEKSGDRKKALDLVKAIVKINPQNADALNFIGYVYTEDGANLKEALELIEQANLLKPNAPHILDSLGWVYFKLGDLEKARVNLEKAVKLASAEPVIIAHLGEVILKKGDVKKAMELFKRAFDLVREGKGEFTDSEKKWIEERYDAISKS